ncbi:flavodoxin family protein [Legionella fallonii]|uniref:Flavodoxin/nitric oxide synthase n=1 Tax=Legionella fallonii LLAP-10 TaxID=1212491 RepID=A0A098G8S2_9GAMM|nr:flavodoxin family protein [Legionella fallonii]CEG58873.1 Flavodoxin/nitric oxide synthase [Legionella fallonii LLAP-10]
MINVQIIFHSGYGHTAKQADAVFHGFKDQDRIQANLIQIDSNGDINEESWALIAQAHAIVFGSPTYMGGPSWQFKKFADASSKAWMQSLWKDKICAGFTNSGSMNGDKLSTLHYFFTLAMQHGMIWVGTGMQSANTKAAVRNDLNYLGSYAGAMAQSPVDSSSEEGPLPGDLSTAQQFGARIADMAIRFHNGL